MGTLVEVVFALREESGIPFVDETGRNVVASRSKTCSLVRSVLPRPEGDCEVLTYDDFAVSVGFYYAFSDEARLCEENSMIEYSMNVNSPYERKVESNVVSKRDLSRKVKRPWRPDEYFQSRLVFLRGLSRTNGLAYRLVNEEEWLPEEDGKLMTKKLTLPDLYGVYGFLREHIGCAKINRQKF